jgi:hypothetical protein
MMVYLGFEDVFSYLEAVPSFQCWERAESLTKCHQSGFICSVPENIHALCLSTYHQLIYRVETLTGVGFVTWRWSIFVKNTEIRCNLSP